MARSKKPEKKATLNHLAKYRIGPELFKEIKETNEKILSAASKCALECVTPHIVIAKPGSNEGHYRLETKGTIVCVSEDAPEVALQAAQFLMARAMLDAAIKEGDIPIIREIAIYLGVSAVDTMLESRSGVRMHYLLTKHTASKRSSSKGGSRKPAWERVADFAPELFEKFKRGEAVSDHAALLRTRAELGQLQKQDKFKGKVPGLTCLRDHLLKKPSSGK